MTDVDAIILYDDYQGNKILVLHCTTSCGWLLCVSVNHRKDNPETSYKGVVFFFHNLFSDYLHF